MSDNLQPTRRSFMEWSIHGLGAIFAAVLGIPAALYLVDPRHRKQAESNYRTVEGVDPAALEINQPQQGAIRDMRTDAWTLYPNDVIGRVWVVKHGPGANDLQVFTTICPHLGCSINLDRELFACPCHGAEFNLNGQKTARGGVAPRGMDTLTWRIPEDDPNVLQVEYQRFQPLQQEKLPLA